MKSFYEFMDIHFFLEEDGLRLGQRFCNMFIRNSWPELYYERDPHSQISMIWEWLENHQYTEQLPQRFEEK